MTQNEKDRAFLNERLYDFEHRENIHVRDQRTMFEVANRLLTEREHADTVYKIHDKKRSVTHYFKNVSHLYNDEFTQEKGIWIADVDGEDK